MLTPPGTWPIRTWNFSGSSVSTSELEKGKLMEYMQTSGRTKHRTWLKSRRSGALCHFKSLHQIIIILYISYVIMYLKIGDAMLSILAGVDTPMNMFKLLSK